MNNNTPKKGKVILPYIFLFLAGVLITLGGIFLYKQNETRNKTYIPIAADLYSADKIYKAGRPFYKLRYSYKVNKKTYMYNYPKEIETEPQNIIVIKYNKDNPKEIYNKDIDNYGIILSVVGIVISILSIIIKLALTTTIPTKTIQVVVEDTATCIGGRKIYMADTSISPTDERAKKDKYYVIFSNNLEKYKIGNTIEFNANQYGEVLSTEKYKNNIIAKSLNNFKDEDLILINK